MQRFRWGILGLALAILFQPTAEAQTKESFDKQKLDRYLTALADENKIMGSVAIDSAGDEVYYRSLGFRAPDKSQADKNTQYRIGSVSKTFTATMIMQLIEEGELSLSAVLAEYYPEIPQADDITIEHLLRHQSGLYNFTNAADYTDWMTEERSKEQLLELFYEHEPQFAPGERTSYSNTNYVLLSYIIEDITGDSYDVQLQQRIVDPLNLQHTSYGDGIDVGNNEATSFRYQSQWVEASETDMSIPAGAGALVSTTGDLTDFIRALFKGKLVSQKSLDSMTTIEQGLGMGLMKIPFYDTVAYGHNGGIDGFQSNLSYFPKQDVAVAFTGNGLNYSMNEMLVGILSIYFNHDYEIPSFDETTITLTADQMQQYVGAYASDQIPLDIEVFVEDSTLKAQASGQAAFPLTANDKATLRFDPAGVIMQFDSLKTDKYHQFMLKQGGGSFLFNRQ